MTAKDGTNRGRPTKFNDERAIRAIEAARDGRSVAGCGRAAGVTEGTVENWLDQGYSYTDKQGNERDFFQDFTRARSDGESLLVNCGLNGTYDSSMTKFLLARSFGYEKKTKLEHSGPDGGPIKTSAVIPDYENMFKENSDNENEE